MEKPLRVIGEPIPTVKLRVTPRQYELLTLAIKQEQQNLMQTIHAIRGNQALSENQQYIANLLREFDTLKEDLSRQETAQ